MQAECKMRTAIRTGALCNRVVIGLRSSCSIHRLPEPLDRRGLKIELTRAAWKLVDRILPQLSIRPEISRRTDAEAVNQAHASF
jgi:hypothetical protein